MKCTIVFLHAPVKPHSQPRFLPVNTECQRIEDAYAAAIDTAMKHLEFAGWCEGFEIVDGDGILISQWNKSDTNLRPPSPGALLVVSGP